MHATLKSSLALAAVAIAAQASAQITFYEHDNYRGQSFTTQRQVGNFERQGYNDRASSAVVARGERWEVCDDVRFSGRCVVLRQGNYPSLAAMGLNDRISSVRNVSRNMQVDDGRYAPEPMSMYDSRRRNSERLFEADVTSVRAVVGTPERRCWIEREQVVQDHGNNNVPGAIAGALIGGILGHQIGGGSGRDIATAGGVVGGAVVGSRVGRDNDGRQTTTQNVQRCTTNSGPARPDYWDVTYTFRGQEHRVQMTSAPGPTITVNRQGEPRA